MHPVVILVPVAALVFGPHLWVRHVLKRHNRVEDERFSTGSTLARELLDGHQLQRVRVELTDLGDHYDPEARAVRLMRDKYDRRTLTAVTTAAHEVAHALQDAADYGPFVWRGRLVALARMTGQFGSVILVAVPTVALLARRPIPSAAIAAAAFAMLSTAVAAQLVALPTELDASFRRALPMLRAGYISEEQVTDAREILMASSLTYVAASLLAVLNIWPWLGRGTFWRPVPSPTRHFALAQAPADFGKVPERQVTTRRRSHRRPNLRRPGALETAVRIVGKPLIRGWLQLACKG